MGRQWVTPEQRAAVIGTRVAGEGPRPSKVMAIGEFPGIEEGLRDRPFIGRSGREFRRFLNGYELPRPEDIYLTNLSKTVAVDMKSSVVTDQDIDALWDELDAVQPQVILTLGARVTQFFLGDDATLEAMHAIPHRPDSWGLRFIDRAKHYLGPVPVILPAYNPAAALYSPGLQSFFAMGMKALSLLLKGKLSPPPRDERDGVYTTLPAGHWTSLPSLIAVDTEGWAHKPWCISYSGAAYSGTVIRYGGHENFVNSIRYRQPRPPRIVIHNALHDLDVLDRGFGCPLDEWGIEFDDTMVMAYLLGLEPQGLKPLAYRHAGMLQDDYADLTAEAGEAGAFEWLYALALRLPMKVQKITTKRDKKAWNIDPDADAWFVLDDVTGEPLIATTTPPDVAREELAHCRTLIERMLAKPGQLATRWGNSTARETLVDELGFLPPFENGPEEPTLDAIPIATAVKYAARDADATIRIYPRLSQQIDAFGLRDVYDVDMAIMPMIARMQHVGLKVDVPHFESLSVLFAVEAEVNADAILLQCGEAINPNSGDQVAAYLFDHLKIQDRVVNLRLKKTKSGERYTTNDKVLDALKGADPSVELFQEGREIRKLKGTYADAIPRLIGRDGRLHPNYRITRTDTGRLSANKPNMLALPKHSKRGKLIRMGFVADEGHELGEWDLAQIEMCVFAHDSGDERMIAEILSGIDKHAATASNMFGRKAELIYAESQSKSGAGVHQRFAAKAVNFGILMGITEYGLLDQFHKNGMLDWTQDRCAELLGEWFRAYPGAAKYIEAKHAEARRHGFVRDMFGRLRWLEGIHSDDEYISAEAERMAQATPVQSGAQGIIKRVMQAVWPVLKALRGSFWIEPLLQVHDALVLEYDADQRALVDSVMMTAMTTTVQLKVPVKASHSFGLRLGEL